MFIHLGETTSSSQPDEIVEMILLEISKMFDDNRVVVRRKIEAVHLRSFAKTLFTKSMFSLIL